ncbi:MAG: hypothetical protein ACM3SS_18365 [Rhodospirillaceae bacterium]
MKPALRVEAKRRPQGRCNPAAGPLPPRYFVDEPLVDPVVPVPVLEPEGPVVAPGAEAADSELVDGLLGAVELGGGALEEGPLLGGVVLGVVVVLDGLLVSLLPQP